MSSSVASSARGGLLILQRQAAATPLPGLPRHPVTPLVIANDRGGVLQPARPPQLVQPAAAQVVQAAADLLRRHLRIFPPAGPRPGRPRTSALKGTTSGDASARCNGGPRSGGSPTRPCFFPGPAPPSHRRSPPPRATPT